MSTVAASFKPRRRQHQAKTLKGVAYYVTASVLALLFLFPVFYTVLRSFEGDNADTQGFSFSSLTLNNYAQVFDPSVHITTYLKNSLILAIGVAIITCVCSTLAGYALSRFEFRGAGLLFILILTPMLVPSQGLLTPLSILLSWLHLTNTLVGVILVLATFQLPFSTFVMRNTFASIPLGLEEAAMLDGAGVMYTLRKVMLPLSWPGMVTVGLFGFMAGWNDLLTSVVFLSDQSKYTMPIALTDISSTVNFGVSVVHPGLLTATACVATVPVMLLFIALQRYYTRGLVAGAVK